MPARSFSGTITQTRPPNRFPKVLSRRNVLKEVKGSFLVFSLVQAQDRRNPVFRTPGGFSAGACAAHHGFTSALVLAPARRPQAELVSLALAKLSGYCVSVQRLRVLPLLRGRRCWRCRCARGSPGCCSPGAALHPPFVCRTWGHQ